MHNTNSGETAYREGGLSPSKKFGAKRVVGVFATFCHIVDEESGTTVNF